jgi:hypothetical protein
MDQQSNEQLSPALSTQMGSVQPTQTKPKRKVPSGKTGVLIFLGVIVVVALAISIIGLNRQQAQSKAQTAQVAKATSLEKRVATLEAADSFAQQQVDKDRYQAVFLTGGQVYFGNITTITKDTIKLENIYYLKTGTVDKSGNPTAGSDASLVKLGNELHKPDDAMIIERKNVSFWENLKGDSEVSTAIDSYKKTNPR